MSSSTKDDTTLHYLATGLVEWEETSPDKRIQIPQSLRIGMSRMYAAAALSQKQVPTTLPTKHPSLLVVWLMLIVMGSTMVFVTNNYTGFKM